VRQILSPASRLIAVFILTMIASGGILTYLSINSISNFKELTEKKIKEEQASIAGRLSSNIQQALENAAGNFTNIMASEDVTDIFQKLYFDTLSLIEDPFIVNRSNAFIWPWFLENRGIGPEVKSSAAYQQALHRAERMEFMEGDYTGAVQNYRQSQAYAAGKIDSARSVNGLARVYLKMGDHAKAFSCYSEITSDSYSVIDPNGFPFVYYAIINILERGDTFNKDLAGSEIEIFLSRVVNGTIPLNNSTEDILAGISSWYNENHDFKDEKAAMIENKIRIIYNRLKIVNDCGSFIMDFLHEKPDQENTPRLP